MAVDVAAWIQTGVGFAAGYAGIPDGTAVGRRRVGDLSISASLLHVTRANWT